MDDYRVSKSAQRWGVAVGRDQHRETTRGRVLRCTYRLQHTWRLVRTVRKRETRDENAEMQNLTKIGIPIDRVY